MARYNKAATDGPSSEDKALDLFAEMMIEKIESINKDWKKTVVYGGGVAMAEEPEWQGIQRSKCVDAASSMRKTRLADTTFLYL